jgi:hypothetical protein
LGTVKSGKAKSRVAVSEKRDASKTKDALPGTSHAPETLSIAPAIKKFTSMVAGVEDQVRTINELKKENTGIVGGVGDALSSGMRFFGGSGFETGKDAYESQIKQAQARSQEIHAQLLAEFEGKAPSPSPAEQAQIVALVARLGKTTGAKLNNVSWGTAVSNSFGVDGKAESSVASRAVHGALGIAEGVFDMATSVADLTKFV